MKKNITMYSTTWCSDCRNAKRFLQSKNIDFNEIDIDNDSVSANQIIEWSGGRRVIPTFKIIDETSGIISILHNPKLEILDKEIFG